jgi:hypothetical protein
MAVAVIDGSILPAMKEKRSSLFHAIVVVGAALGAGCGDDERLPPTDSPAADTVVADARAFDAAATDGSGADTPPTDASPIDGDAMVIIL